MPFRKRTKKRLKRLKEVIIAGGSMTKACEYADISVVSLWQWCRSEPEVAEQIEDWKLSRVKYVEDALFKTAINGSVRAQEYILNNRGRKWSSTPVIIDQSKTLTLIQQIHHNYNDKDDKTKSRSLDDKSESRDKSRDRLQVIK